VIIIAVELIALKNNKITALPKVNAFLTSMLRNSVRSKYAYQYGLTHFQKFIAEKYSKYNLETIFEPLLKNEINLYEILDGFVSYLLSVTPNLTSKSIKLYMASVRSYLAYYDIDVIPSKFRRKVKMPKAYREDEQALDVNDIRKILLSCNNRRLKAYLLVLASGAMRAVEGLAIRLKDIDFSVSPTKIHIRKEYAKTRVARDIFISDEATHYLKQWLNWKYDNEKRPRTSNPDDLVFTLQNSTNPNGVYVKILEEFEKLLDITGFGERKEGTKRRKVTLHSLRRHAKSVISNQVNQDYSEWFLGHNKSPYYTIKETERRDIYATKCMKYLTFLDYATLEATGKNIEAKLQEKDIEMQSIKQKYDQDIITIRKEMDQKINQIMSMIQRNPKLAQIKPEVLVKKKL
jgi:integrase